MTELIGTAFADYFVDNERAMEGVQEAFRRGVVTDYDLLRQKLAEERAVEAGFDGPITKPIDPRTFAETVTASLDARAADDTTTSTTAPATGDVRVSNGVTHPLEP